MYQVIIAAKMYEVVRASNGHTIYVGDSMLAAVARCRRANIEVRTTGEYVPMWHRVQA
jgi:hypothetical protein